ncbi:MAG: polysaccharide biosynthesis/export family protein [Bacteroidales bacterium]|nr:polysaccharide biosynthesis/export family protein [Bacteroidales bacterium]
MSIRNRLLLLVLVVTACSCGTHKHRYLHAPKDGQQEVVYQKLLEEYHLQPNDILYVNVLTTIEEYAGLFNSSSHQQMNTVSNSYLYFTGYPIDITGNIEIPLIGKVQVAGMTAAEAEKLIHEKISKIVYDSHVVARLAGFRVNIVGEVKSPGEYIVYREHATVLEALSLAGDMNYYGNRQEIMIVRNTKDGAVTHTIDLTDRKALSSPAFYLQPNDLVYVQPLPRTIFRVNISDIVTYLSAISSSLALVVAIISLTK